MILRDPDVKFVFGEVRNVAVKRRGILAQRVADQDPAYVSPPFAVARGVRVAFFIRKLMMPAMCGDPEKRSTFHGDDRANREEILDPLWRFVAPMGKQTVITHPDAEAARYPI